MECDYKSLTRISYFLPEQLRSAPAGLCGDIPWMMFPSCKNLISAGNPSKAGKKKPKN